MISVTRKITIEIIFSQGPVKCVLPFLHPYCVSARITSSGQNLINGALRCRLESLPVCPQFYDFLSFFFSLGCHLTAPNSEDTEPFSVHIDHPFNLFGLGIINLPIHMYRNSTLISLSFYKINFFVDNLCS